MASKKSGAKKSHVKAASLTTPKKKTKKVQNVRPHRKPAPKAAKSKATQSKRDASKYVRTIDVGGDALRTAKKHFKKPVVEAFIDAAAKTPSTVRAVKELDGAMSYEDGLDMMKQPSVQLSVANRRAMTLAAECGITSQMVMTEFRRMGMSNMKRYGALLVADSVVEELESMSDDDTAAIQELTTETYWDEEAEKTVKRVKIKLYPKGDALTKMAQHLGLKGFGGQLGKAGVDRVGMQTVVAPDGTVTTTAIVQHLPDEELEQIALGIEDAEQYSERTE